MVPTDPLPNKERNKAAMDLLAKWAVSVGAIQDGHYATSRALRRAHTGLGLTTVLALTLTAGRIGSGEDLGGWLDSRMAVLLTVLALVLTGLQTFLRLEERAEPHRRAGVRMGALLRLIHETISLAPADIRPHMDRIREKWDEVQEEAPMLPKRQFVRRLLEIIRGKPAD